MEERANRKEPPYQEPEHSTVEDWHGRELAREEDVVDRLVDETGGNLDEAEYRFEQQSGAGEAERRD